MSINTNVAHAPRHARTSGQARLIALSLRVRLRRARIDRDLAEARISDHSDEHILRAAQLTSAANRRDAARSLHEVVDFAENPRAELLSSTALLEREAVLPSRDALMGLAARLEHSGPVGACGVARARALMSDGMGPLYNPNSARSLGEAISWVADGLEIR